MLARVRKGVNRATEETCRFLRPENVIRLVRGTGTAERGRAGADAAM
jgi:hypothetical protein